MKKLFIGCFLTTSIFSSNVLAEDLTSNFNSTATLNNSCSIAIESISFGAYNPSIDQMASGKISYTCTKTTSFKITISPGSSGTFERTMINNSNSLKYNIYKESSLTEVWGDDSRYSERYCWTIGGGGYNCGNRNIYNPTSVSDIGNGMEQTSYMYALVPKNQYVVPGSYSDVLIASIIF